LHAGSEPGQRRKIFYFWHIPVLSPDEHLLPPYLLHDGVTVSQVVTSAGGPWNGGTLTSGEWVVRQLNVAVNKVVGVPAGLPSWFTFSAPTFDLTAGWYHVEGYACGYGVDSHQCALSVLGVPFILGTPEFSSATTPSTTKSTFSLEGYFDAWTFSLVHNCDTTKAFTGGGFIGSLGVSNQTFAQVKIVRLS
jgi:hypothetical protein